jgi:hypothetical protein
VNHFGLQGASSKSQVTASGKREDKTVTSHKFQAAKGRKSCMGNNIAQRASLEQL